MNSETEMKRSEQAIDDAIYNNNRMMAIQDNVTDLYWEYDRMSSSGQKSLDALAKIVGVPTEKEMKQQSKVTGEIK
tara:strand:+ start:168 stop:395 length:228 start_codon:yes stop_codon:yes gene_type:complete